MDTMSITIDTREQDPWTEFPAGVTTVRGTLDSGDYQLTGLPAVAERKSIADLTNCCTGENRARFKRELVRLAGLPCKAVVIEGAVDEIYRHTYRSRVPPESVIGSCMSWQTRYQIPFVFAGARPHCARIVVAIFRTYLGQIHETMKALDAHGGRH